MSTPSTNIRFLVGIDLGTTNCSACYIDLTQQDRALQDLPILQLVASGETASENLLPSFCYLPGDHELPAGAISLPWEPAPKLAVGRFAREQGSRLPDRLVASAKSWLAHAGVNRTSPILPWGSELGDQMLSPVTAAANYLSHIKNAWNAKFGKQKDADGTPCLLENQSLILTVPASFDETARELTVEAARDAGLTRLTLIEEPLAAFYAWLAQNESNWKSQVSTGDVVLVVDVGGGTTDLTIVEIESDDTLRRKAVGEHLLLGGDNMDMTLARHAEAAWNTKLPQRQWTRLCQECRRAKETLLANDAPNSTTVTITGEGSSLFAQLKTHEFTKEQVHDIILEGFFPKLQLSTGPVERKRALQEMGLPYSADPAITRHIGQFLAFAGQTLAKPEPVAHPTKVLFNGGALLPETLRKRILDVIASWFPDSPPPTELQSEDFSLAVSRGAAFYGLARAGEAVRVKGGIANAYCLQIDRAGHDKLLCVMPRDTEEGTACKLDETFTLQANIPVAFPLHASATRLDDKLGDLLDLPQDTITPLQPLHTSLKFGRKTDRTELKVNLASRLNEIGTLEVWCETIDTGHRFPLTFDLRGSNISQTTAIQQDQVIVDDAKASAALALVNQAFTDQPALLASILPKLEEILDLPRVQWSAPLLRRLADLLLQHPEFRQISSEHEARWLNLTGFALRPGTGCVGDDLRIRNAWKLWKPGPLAAKNASVQQNWFIFWRRLAGGLSAGQQDQIASPLAKNLIPKDGKIRLKRGDQLAYEQWRCLASMERISHKTKLKIVDSILSTDSKLDPELFWALARLTSRTPIHGTIDTIIPQDKLQPIFGKLLNAANQVASQQSKLPFLAILAAATCTGIRTIDLPEPTRQQAADFLAQNNLPEDWTSPILAAETAEDDASWKDQLRGDTLPMGLKLN
mgnify:CR=1 FL=1